MLIGIYSSTSSCGKTTIAKYLEDKHCFVRLSFATPLKNMVGVLLKNLGYTEELAALALLNKEHPISEVDSRVDVRHLLRTLGTEWGRDCVHPELWLNCWIHSYTQLKKQGVENVVVDDLRFYNEAQLVARCGGQLRKVHRLAPTKQNKNHHRPEGGLDHLPYRTELYASNNKLCFDKIISNVGSIEDLHKQINTSIIEINNAAQNKTH